MEDILVLNRSMIDNIPLVSLRVDNTDQYEFQLMRKAVIEISNHKHPAEGKDYDSITDIQTFLKIHYSKLTPYEMKEVQKYCTIYYYGEKAPFKVIPNNNNYKIALFDHIDFRYEIWNILGRGSFAIVLECYDHYEKQFVALKGLKIREKLEDYMNNEIEILKLIKEKSDENERLKDLFVNFLRTFIYNGYIFLVFEKLSKDLSSIMKGGYRFRIDIVKHFTHTLMEALHELNKIKIIHLDLKPNNLLLVDEIDATPMQLKVSDFGLSCFHSNLKRSQAEKQLRFYKPPEAILGGPIGPQIDMWSAACAIIKLHTGYPFIQGEDSFDQLTKIIEVIGVPPKRFLRQCSYASDYFYGNSVPRYCSFKITDGRMSLTPGDSLSGEKRLLPGTRTLQSILNCDNNSFHDFITRCLDWDPSTRLTPEEALHHPFLTNPCVPPKKTQPIFPRDPISPKKRFNYQRLELVIYVFLAFVCLCIFVIYNCMLINSHIS